MKTPHSQRGFTRLELAVFLIFMGLVIFVTVAFLLSGGAGKKIVGKAARGKAIYNWVQAYANDHHQQFPEAPNNSNEAFRQLFISQYTDDEQQFAIPGDAWLKTAPGGKGMPDNLIGPAPGFPQALEPGECSYAYVTGLDAASQSNLPLLCNAFTETVGVYTTDKSKKGGVMGNRAIWVSVSGAARVADVRDQPGIMEKKQGHDVNVFSPEWGTDLSKVKNPAP